MSAVALMVHVLCAHLEDMEGFKLDVSAVVS